MTRVVAYIDGFNLYHAIDDLGQPHLKWLDLWSLCQDLLKDGDTLEAVNYFSAYYTANQKRHRRHERYVNALKNKVLPFIWVFSNAKPFFAKAVKIRLRRGRKKRQTFIWPSVWLQTHSKTSSIKLF